MPRTDATSWSSIASERTSASSRVATRSFPYSVIFDGTGDYVDFGNVYGPERTTTFSMCGYFIIDAFTGTNNQTVIRKSSTAGSAQGWAIYVDISLNTLHFFLGGTTAGNRLAVGTSSDYAITEGTPYFWSASYDGSSTAAGVSLVCIPVGSPLSSFATKASPVIDTLSSSIVTASALRIGATADGVRAWTGVQQKLAIYNTTLSLADVQSIYYDNIYPTTGLLSIWLGEGTNGSGASVSDEFDNKTGTITGATWSSSRVIFTPRAVAV